MTSFNSPPELNPAQEHAITVLRKRAVTKRASAVQTIQHVLRMSNIPLSTLDEIRTSVQTHARVAVHFHPDRPVDALGERTVTRALLEDGTYKNQFETGISNGGMSAFAGGARDEWERALFAGAYHSSSLIDVAASARPKYGALDVMGVSDGPAPRFGCCYLLLKPAVSARTTFTFGGSQDGPAHVGTMDELDDVLAALFEECFVRDTALGVRDIRPAGLIERIRTNGAGGSSCDRTQPPSRNLDHYIEAQIHGPIRLACDIESLVVDPSFRSTQTWADLQAMGAKYAFPIYTHPGFRMPASEIPLDFRGPTMPSLAARICSADGMLDAAVIGAAVCELRRNSEAWTDRGSPADVLQELKLLWHVLLRYGRPLHD